MTDIRRSSRERKSANTYYDEAKEAEDVKRSSPSPRKRRQSSRDNDDDSDNNNNSDHDSIVSEPRMDDPSSDDSSSDDDSEAPASKRRTNKRSPTKIHVQYNKNNKANKSKANKSPGKNNTSNINLSNKKGPAARGRALDVLRRKTLDPTKETAENSLTAAILLACCPKAKPKTNYDDHNDTDNDIDNPNRRGPRYPDAFVPTAYTTALEPIVLRVLAEYQTDANKTHVDLLNLVFRSVGGSFDTSLDPATTELDDMDDDEWEQVVTDVVDGMRHTPPDAILTCSCPEGALFASSVGLKSSLAQEDYREILDHFWYLLGTLGLSSASSSVSTTNNKNKSSSSNGGEGGHSASFDIERIRDLCQRMMELCAAGQPDLRSSATVAAMQLALAACDGTLEFQARLATAQRQLKAAKAAKTKTKGKGKTKQEALEKMVTALERASDDLEQVVTQTVVPGVFMKRYRDSDKYIRAFCLKALSRMMLQRPDLFLRDTYLKYYGWLMSDKDAVVRETAIDGLLAPFLRAEEQAKMSNAKSIHPLQVLSLEKLEKVVHKFLPRVADCVIDSDTKVQQHAMSLLLALNRNGLLDELDDDRVWNQINLRALAPDTTAEVRRDALYFVMEQLESFDEENTSSNPSHTPERQKVDQIDAVATWVAHALSDGKIPMEHLRVHLTTFIVQSIRDMPKHAHLMTDWNAILRAIQHDTEANLSESQQQRVTLAKQRVLLQMLASAVDLEVGTDNAEDEVSTILDPDVVRVKSQLLLTSGPSAATTSTTGKQKKKKTKKHATNISRETLTVALLKSLPKLLEAYKGDLFVLRSLTTLPRYFVPSVLTLPNRKAAVQSLTSLLADLFLESTDTTVLQNTCVALCMLANGGDHARNREALLKLRSVACTVKKRLLQLYEDQPKKPLAGESTSKKTTNRGSTRSPQQNEDEDDDDEDTKFLDQQHGILLCLRRLRILSKRRYLGDLFALDQVGNQDESIAAEDADPCVHLCAAIAQETAKNLRKRQVVLPEDEEASIQIPAIWSEMDPRVHQTVAAAVVESLQLILSLTAWRFQHVLSKEQDAKDQLTANDDDELSKGSDDEDGDNDRNDGSVELDEVTVAEIDYEKKLLIRMTLGQQKLLGLCFDQFLEDFDDDEGESIYSYEHIEFSNYVQIQAGKVAGDLRSLFPKELKDSESPLLRACALVEDSHLIGGFVRFFRSKEDHLAEANRGRKMKEELLLPMSRGICASWLNGNRREAGTVLAQIGHPSIDVSKSTLALCRVLKKIDPVRLLESHMATLRQGYTDWIDNEPAEPESDRPSEQEMEEFEVAEEEHAASFKAVENQAIKLAATLGVGKLNNPELANALLNFMKDGMKYSFQFDSGSDEENCNLGGNLTFLSVLVAYLKWVKKEKSAVKQLRRLFDALTAELRAHSDFDDIPEEDLEVMNSFGRALGVIVRKKATPAPATSESDIDEEDDDVIMKTPASNTSKHRLSTASSVGSLLSNNLSPLYEEDVMNEGEENEKGNSDDDKDEDEDDDDQVEPSPKKRQKKRNGSSLKPQETIREASDEEGSGDSSIE